MRPDEFDTEIGRLRDVFGDRAFPSERATLIWDEIKSMPAHWLKRTVDGFIGEARQPPMLSDFRNSAYYERSRNRPIDDSNKFVIKPGHGCMDCKDTGVFVCRHRENKNLYAFRCTCSLGANDDRKAIPQFKTGHMPHYEYLDLARTDNINKSLQFDSTAQNEGHGAEVQDQSMDG